MISTKNQEAISQSYFLAIAAKADLTMNIYSRDENSTDASLEKMVVYSNGQKFKAKIDVQLKSVYSSNAYHYNEKGNIVYNLKVKNYNDLVAKSNHPQLLVLLILPQGDENDWILQSTDKLIIKRCMYYASFADNQPSSNTDTITVTICKDNVFNVENINKLFKKIAYSGSV